MERGSSGKAVEEERLRRLGGKNEEEDEEEDEERAPVFERKVEGGREGGREGGVGGYMRIRVKASKIKGGQSNHLSFSSLPPSLPVSLSPSLSPCLPSPYLLHWRCGLGR